MKRILIATDGSPGATNALRAGLELARDTGASVLVVAARYALPAWGDTYYAAALAAERDELQSVLEEALARAAEYRVAAEAELLTGEPVDEILRSADERGAELVVVGSRGLGRIRSTLLGSVSRELVARAHVPVLVVPAHAPVPAAAPARPGAAATGSPHLTGHEFWRELATGSVYAVRLVDGIVAGCAGPLTAEEVDEAFLPALDYADEWAQWLEERRAGFDLLLPPFVRAYAREATP